MPLPTTRVGVGGHALHGGYGVSSHTKGLALDWMVGATIVLANSSVVNVSATENPDLFWAIRGAGSSMGIVQVGGNVRTRIFCCQN
jgi:FAD/FMN-containing dehydrogenase